MQVGLFFLALRTAVPDDDVLVVHQSHALHEVITKFCPVRIGEAGAFLYRGALITGGVGEALIATATGLCVAVLALIVHSYFSNRLDSVLTDVENVCTVVISKARGK